MVIKHDKIQCFTNEQQNKKSKTKYHYNTTYDKNINITIIACNTRQHSTQHNIAQSNAIQNRHTLSPYDWTSCMQCPRKKSFIRDLMLWLLCYNIYTLVCTISYKRIVKSPKEMTTNINC